MKIVEVLSLLALLLFGCASLQAEQGMEDGRAYRGSKNAPLTIYEYSDFECPFCSKVQPTIKEVLNSYPGKVKLVFRHYPLEFHQRAMPAAIAATCAEEQGKFWEMHDILFANQHALSDSDLEKYAAQIGLEMQEFRACLSSDRAKQKVLEDMREAASSGVQATPTFKVGETLVMGAQPFGKFKQAIDSELAKLRS
ncbi:MAG: thioredoxin domain-containing protein [Candidatus Anstonellaceae archaeon]